MKILFTQVEDCIETLHRLYVVYENEWSLMIVDMLLCCAYKLDYEIIYI